MGEKMLERFFKYTEIKTKITSLFAFLMSIAYLFYIKTEINWKLMIIFFASMLIFDLTTTAINNYTDTKTNGQKLDFERTTALMIILIMLFISAGLGLYLVYLTDIVVLITGVVCFICGILYTFGPVPISRQPLGEILSGIFYGFMIPFLILYINMPEGTLLTFGLSLKTIDIRVNVMPLLSLILLSTIPVCTTANIMLANNTCDVERDILVNRFTLPYYLGKKSVYLFAGIYYACYADIILMVVFRVLSPLCLIALITLIPVQKNISEFLKVQDKEKTFIVSIKNYVLIMGAITIMIFVSGLL
jgi:1,4-dihydroxy-2-naphthoate octaprenyltransferase